MFLNATIKHNPKLIETALALHRDGVIPPNCFVIDMEAVSHNASLIKRAADANGLALYFTTKQVGFNPLIAKCVVQAGIHKALAVDASEASVLSRNGIPIGHVGHLGQIPYHLIGPILSLEPEVVTVFSVAKAQQISEVATHKGKNVRLLLRVASEGDFFFPGQAGGFGLQSLRKEASAILELPGVQIAGVTSYPCLQFDEALRVLRPTLNFQTILQAARMLQDELGIHIEQINAPGNTCVSSMALLAQMGATHAEPGHALTGTTYLHAHLDQPEKPAMVYVSEVSHLFGNKAYALGGGIYRRAKVNNALVGASPDKLVRTEIIPLDPTAIDYYALLRMPHEQAIRIGDTVIVASRAQIFVTRSYVAIVEGIQEGNPALAGVFDALGNPVDRIFG